MISIICIYSVLVVIYAITQVKCGFVPQLISKMLCSFSFVSIAVVCGINNNKTNDLWFMFFVLALIFSFIGDFFIVMQRRKLRNNYNVFIAGGICFFMAHIIFLLAYINKNGIEIISLFGAIIFSMIALFLCNKFENRGIAVRVIITGYIFILTFMMFNGLSFIRLNSTFGNLVAIGSLLFFISDIILYMKFFAKFTKRQVSKTTTNIARVSNTATYFAAQLLLALTVIYC